MLIDSQKFENKYTGKSVPLPAASQGVISGSKSAAASPWLQLTIPGFEIWPSVFRYRFLNRYSHPPLFL